MLANLRDRIIVGKYLLRNYHRLWTAWVHFRRYKHFYLPEQRIAQVIGRTRRTSLGLAAEYVLCNPKSFDRHYFPDMEKSLVEKFKILRAGGSL